MFYKAAHERPRWRRRWPPGALHEAAFVMAQQSGVIVLIFFFFFVPLSFSSHCLLHGYFSTLVSVTWARRYEHGNASWKWWRRPRAKYGRGAGVGMGNKLLALRCAYGPRRRIPGRSLPIGPSSTIDRFDDVLFAKWALAPKPKFARSMFVGGSSEQSSDFATCETLNLGNSR